MLQDHVFLNGQVHLEEQSSAGERIPVPKEPDYNTEETIWEMLRNRSSVASDPAERKGNVSNVCKLLQQGILTTRWRLQQTFMNENFWDQWVNWLSSHFLFFVQMSSDRGATG